MIRVKAFVCPHEGDEVFRFGEVDDIMGIAGEHMDDLDVFPVYVEVQHFVGIDLTLLNETFPGDYDEQLPFGVVPMLSLGDTGF